MTLKYIESSIKESCPICESNLSCNVHFDIDHLSGQTFSQLVSARHLKELPHILQFNSKSKLFTALTDVIGLPYIIDVNKPIVISTPNTHLFFKFSCEEHKYFNRSQFVSLTSNSFDFSMVQWKKSWERLEISIHGYDKFIFGIDKESNQSTIEHKNFKVFENKKESLPFAMKLDKLPFDNREVLLEKLGRYYLLK